MHLYSSTLQYSWNVDNDVDWIADVENAGPDDANNVAVTLQLPNGNMFNSADTRGSGSYTYNSTTNTVTWNIGYMPDNSIVYMDVFSRVTQSGTLTATLTKTGETEYDPVSSNNQKSRALTVAPAVDVQVTQTVNGQKSIQASVGSTVTYVVTLQNNGPNDATGVVIYDKLPAGLNIGSILPSAGSYNSTSGLWTVGNLNYGSTATLTITATVTGTGTIINNPSYYNTDQYDWNYNDSSQETYINIGRYTPSADVNVHLYSSTLQYSWNVDNDVDWIADVENAGPDDANNVAVTLQLPNGNMFNSADTRGSGSYTYNSTTNTVTWNIGYMPDNSIVYMDVFSRVTQSGTLTATLTKTGETEYDPVSSNNQKSRALTVAPAVDVQVTQTVNGQKSIQASVGSTVTYVVTLQNNGPNNATGVVIYDKLPAGLNIGSILPSAGSYNSTSGLWTVGNLNYGSTATLTITATVTGTGTIINNPSYYNTDQYDWNYNDSSQETYING